MKRLWKALFKVLTEGYILGGDLRRTRKETEKLNATIYNITEYQERKHKEGLE